MNQRQRIILIVCAALIAMMLIYPPFQTMGRGSGYSWIFSPPYPIATVNAGQLLVQWVAVLLVGGIMFLLSNGSEPRIDADLTSTGNAAPPSPSKFYASDAAIALSIAGPWRRFCARLIDLWVITFPVALCVALVLGSIVPSFVLWIQRPGAEYIFGWLLMPNIAMDAMGIASVCRHKHYPFWLKRNI